ncbi:MAG: hypothetical protein KDD45_02345 [Bdellovibrionales bacterium]|nr:hypothetical protein [Bdellovibrionales bacterium]
MSKILLVYDDFSELTAIDYSLKKVGFDVIALTNEFTIKDQIVSFNPDLLICNGNSSRVSTVSVGKKIKEMNRWMGKSILIFPQDYEIPPDDLIHIRMDIMLEAPVPLTRLIQVIAKLTAQDEQLIVDKLVKSFTSDKSDQQSYLNQDENLKKAIHHIQGQIDQMQTEAGVDGQSEDKQVSENVSSGLKTEEVETEKIENQEIENQEIESQEETKTTKVPSGNKKSTAPQINNEPNDVKGEKKRFSDPFRELMEELSGNSTSENTETGLESSEATTEPSLEPYSEDPITEDIKSNFQDQLSDHEAKMKEKLKKYSELTQTTSLYPESMLKRVKVRKQFNAIKKDWDKDELSDQDELRREFVKTLFKKD